MLRETDRMGQHVLGCTMDAALAFIAEVSSSLVVDRLLTGNVMP